MTAITVEKRRALIDRRSVADRLAALPADDELEAALRNAVALNQTALIEVKLP